VTTTTTKAKAAIKTAAKPRAKKPATPAPAPATDPGKTLTVENAGKPLAQVKADLAAEGLVMTASVLASFAKPTIGELGLTETVVAMRAAHDKVHGGDLKPVEDMLMSQAATLNAMFCELARRAGLNMGEYMDATERYMRLALKAQSQCRATLEALAEVKNPRAVAFVRQTNVAHGPQQVNNGASPAASPARTEQPATSPNRLLPAPAPGGGLGAELVGAAECGELQEVPR
jgi:hypothetical protein